MNREPGTSATPPEANPSQARNEAGSTEKPKAKKPPPLPAAKKAAREAPPPRAAEEREATLPAEIPVSLEAGGQEPTPETDTEAAASVQASEAAKTPSTPPQPTAADKGRPAGIRAGQPSAGEKTRTKLKTQSPPEGDNHAVPSVSEAQTEDREDVSARPSAKPGAAEESTTPRAAQWTTATLARLNGLGRSVGPLGFLLAGAAGILLLLLVLLRTGQARVSDDVAEMRGQLDELSQKVDEGRLREARLVGQLRQLDNLKSIQQDVGRIEEIRAQIVSFRRWSEETLRARLATPTPPTQTPPTPPPTPVAVDDSDLLVVAVNSKNLAITDFQDVLEDFFGSQSANTPRRRLGFYVAEGARLSTRIDVKTGKKAKASFLIAQPSQDTTEMLDEVGPLLAKELDRTRPSRCLLVASSECRPPSEGVAGWKQLTGLDVILIAAKDSETPPEVLRRWMNLCSLKDGMLCQLQIHTMDGKMEQTFPRAFKSHLGRLTNPVFKGR